MEKANPPISGERKGFDAPIQKQDDDKLGRWEFANEIYNLAISCPKSWSVRIGIYGDWGAGKSSVLSFVRTMAEADGQILIEFDPWGYDSKDSLWREFVAAVYRQFEAYKPPHRKRIWFKAKIGKYGTIAARILKAGNKIAVAGQATEEGLDLVRKYLSISALDLVQLPGLIGDKRIIVLIDDLDRANPALVPGILYALRELVDIPGFSFILAFDPSVISKILEEYNEGFSDGLKFLEKIIDYPRRLPDTKPEQRIELARSDIDRYCPFVDKEALDQIKDMLPDNPRSIRQFIRNISLLEKQVNRYFKNELNWPVLLSASLLKTKIPEYSYKFFSKVDYWEYLEFQGIVQKEGENAEDKFREKIRETGKTIGCTDEGVLSILEKISLRISSFYGLLTGDNIQKLTLLAEEPPAVTLKEFNDLFAQWKKDVGNYDIWQWIQRHGESHNFEKKRVYEDLFEVAISRRLNALAEAADAIEISSMKGYLEEAGTILEFLSLLTFKFGNLKESPSRFSASQFKLVSDMISRYIDFDNTDDYKKLRSAEREYFLKLISEWATGTKDIMRLLKIGPKYEGIEGPSDKHKDLIKEIGKLIIPRFIAGMIANLKEPDHLIWMLRGEDSFSIKSYLCDPDAELWKAMRKAMLELLALSEGDSSVYENIFNLVLYYDYVWRGGHDRIFQEKVTRLLSDKEILGSIWTAITCKRLNPRAVASLKGFPEKAKKDFDTNLVIPKWWPSISHDDKVEKAS